MPCHIDRRVEICVGGEPLNGGNPLPTTGGGGGGGGPATIADGADVTQGAIADAAVTGDNPGTQSAKLRGVNKTLGEAADAAASGNGSLVAVLKRVRDVLQSVWDSVNGRLKVDGSGVTQPVTIPNIADSGSISALGGSVGASTSGCSSVGFVVSGTWSGVLQFQVSVDGTEWKRVAVIDPVNGFRLNEFGFNGTFVALVAGFGMFRLVSTSWTSGTATIGVVCNYGIYPYVENYNLNLLNVTRSTSGADSSFTQNLFYSGTYIFVNITSVTGTPPRPTVDIEVDVFNTLYKIVTFSKAGNLSGPEKLKFLMYPATGGSGVTNHLDGIAPMTLSRSSKISINWTLGAGESVTYKVDIANTV